MVLKNYMALSDAVVFLMDPLVEIVIHDITANKIVYINGSLSGRSVGDPSLLEKEELEDIQNVIYTKMSFDGRLIKSISLVLDQQWLLCINCDLSVFGKMQELSNLFLQSKKTPQPRSLFVNDWQEKLHQTVHGYLQENKLDLATLTQAEKKALVSYLFEAGAFHEKNAADHVAKILTLGRATIFKYLKALRNT